MRGRYPPPPQSFLPTACAAHLASATPGPRQNGDMAGDGPVRRPGFERGGPVWRAIFKAMYECKKAQLVHRMAELYKKYDGREPEWWDALDEMCDMSGVFPWRSPSSATGPAEDCPEPPPEDEPDDMKESQRGDRGDGEQPKETEEPPNKKKKTRRGGKPRVHQRDRQWSDSSGLQCRSNNPTKWDSVFLIYRVLGVPESLTGARGLGWMGSGVPESSTGTRGPS
eukprot:5926274-Pyramimonas_sp.AAC.1